MNINRQIIASWIGYYLDGWADLIENMGDKTQAVGEEVVNQLTEREMPGILIREEPIKEGVLSWEFRNFIITTTPPGARTTIYISKHGKDLYVSWRSFIKVVPNWKLLGLYLIVALAIAGISAFVFFMLAGFATASMIINSPVWPSFWDAIAQWLIMTAIVFVGGLAILVIAGIVAKRNESAYLKKDALLVIILTAFIVALGIDHVGQTLSQNLNGISAIFRAVAMPSFFDLVGILLTTVQIAFYTILFGAAILGFILRTNFLAFILKEPSFFDADDITAMNLSVHKSVLRALDLHGIDTAKLRLKPTFKGGRKNEMV